jgi:anti-sigma B factor antagonist
MTITRHQVEDVTVLSLKGRLILYDGDLLLRQRVDELLAGGDTRLILNLREIDYIDSAGIGMLVAKYVSVRRTGGDMKLLSLSPRAHRALSLTGLLEVFETFDSEPDAVRSFSTSVASH